MVQKFCPECGFKFDREYKFCPECGYTLVKKTASKENFSGFDAQLKRKEEDKKKLEAKIREEVKKKLDAEKKAKEEAEIAALKAKAEKLFKEKSYREALPLILKFAEAGDDKFQFLAGYYYLKCLGTKFSNYTALHTALPWLNKASQNGNVKAEYYIAELYSTRPFGDYDKNKWAEKTAREMLIKLGPKYDRAYKLLATKICGAIADIELYFTKYWESRDYRWGTAGDAYYYGRTTVYEEKNSKTFTIKQNYANAVYWYKKSAEAGYTDSMVMLAKCYLNGHGVEKDATQAVEWFKKGAELGNTQAMCYLGDAYKEGNGVEQDNVKALYWYEKSYASGYITPYKKIEELTRWDG